MLLKWLVLLLTRIIARCVIGLFAVNQTSVACQDRNAKLAPKWC